jgi:hypothetical protein
VQGKYTKRDIPAFTTAQGIRYLGVYGRSKTYQAVWEVGKTADDQNTPSHARTEANQWLPLDYIESDPSGRAV